MFDIFSWQHILILLSVALVVVGPKDLPRLMHGAGKWAAKARGMANEFKRSFEEMARQSELEELRKEIEGLRNNRTLSDIHSQINEPVNIVAVQTGANFETKLEPRVGEFQETETAPPVPTTLLQPVMSAREPSAP